MISKLKKFFNFKNSDSYETPNTLLIKKPKHIHSNEPSMSALFMADKDEIQYFNFRGITTDARVIDVYDGDTIKILFDFEGEITKERVRLWGINSPELDSKDINVKNRAIQARDYLRSIILEKEIQITFFKRDSFGRMLADIYIDNLYVNDDMVKKGHAVEFLRDKNKFK